MKLLNKVALILIIVGALNWGLVGLFKFDIVGGLLGGMDSLLSRIIYTLVGLSGVYIVYQGIKRK